MPTPAFQSKFDAWLDESLAGADDEDVVAFNFNLAEPWSIEVVGCGSYDEDDEDWSTDEVFRPDTDPLELPEAGDDWESVLEFAKLLIQAYLSRPGSGSAALKGSTAVALGFVDGDLHKLWPN
jgi:hypothetical protein